MTDIRESDPLFEVPEDLLEQVKNTPVRSDLEVLRDEVALLRTDVNALIAVLAPVAPFVAQLPEIAQKIDPVLEGLKKSPVLKMLGVSLP